MHLFKEGVPIHQSLIIQRQILWTYISILATISNISQFRLSRETVIDQKHHYPLLVYVQQLHNKIALLEHKISLNNSSISGYKDSSLATTVYTRSREIVASITSSHATEVVGKIFHIRKFCHTQSYKHPAETCVPSNIGISSPTSHWYARLCISFLLKCHPEIALAV